MEESEIDFLDAEHEYRVEGELWASVTEVIWTVRGNRAFMFCAPEVMARARARGIAAHEAARQLDEGILDWDAWEAYDTAMEAAGYQRVLPYVRSYQWWRDETRFLPQENEKIVANRSLRVAGTLDKKGVLFARNSIIDLKSGECPPETGLQTAGYAILDDDVTAARYGLQLIPGKMARLVPYNDPFDIPTFRAFVTAFNWMHRKNMTRRALLEAA
jgi:hypothetical protein